jgi:phage tail-like protein
MAEFPTNTHRKDPYKNFKFRVKWDGAYVAGLAKCGGLKKTTDVIEWRESGDPSVVRKLHGRTTFQPISMEAGVTHDTAFSDWANLVNNNDGTDASSSLKNYRKDITIELLNEMGTVVLAYTVKRAWVSEFQALPDLDASAHAVAITSIKIENEGWQLLDAPGDVAET